MPFKMLSVFSLLLLGALGVSGSLWAQDGSQIGSGTIVGSEVVGGESFSEVISLSAETSKRIYTENFAEYDSRTCHLSQLKRSDTVVCFATSDCAGGFEYRCDMRILDGEVVPFGMYHCPQPVVGVGNRGSRAASFSACEVE